jgi:hypothetical protein
LASAADGRFKFLPWHSDQILLLLQHRQDAFSLTGHTLESRQLLIGPRWDTANQQRQANQGQLAVPH